MRRKRLMTLIHLYLIHRYHAESVHYVSPTEDNRIQTERMQDLGIYGAVATEVGEVIVADVNATRIAELLAPDRAALTELIGKASGP
jgi:isocitrate lyase